MVLRPKIVKLAKMVGGLTGMMNKIDENAPEYYSLECVVSDEQADVALTLGLRKPRTVEYVAKKSGKSLPEARRILLELADIGVCKVYAGEDGEDRFLVQIFAPGILEMMVNNTAQVEKFPQIAKAFEEYTRTRVSSLAAMLPTGMSMMRVIPIESAIEGNSQAVPYEQLSHYLEEYDTFSVAPCSCRRSRRILGQGCGHLEDNMCIQMGDGAEYYIRTGRARQITREEALEILKKAEENGLMHQMPNIEGPGKSAAICNCCACSCFAMRLGTMLGAYDAIRSNFVSQVDKEKCVACGQCVENCPTNALRLGRKLCEKTPIKQLEDYKKCRDHVWGSDNWNEEYRTNRKNVAEAGTAPCKTACPAHIAVQGYIRLAAQGRYVEALELIKKENPFPAVCGRICPRGCESACTRGDVDSPVAIDEIKRFIADKELSEATRFVPKKRHDYGKKIAVIGGGPAGLSCAYYLAIDGYAVTVFEKQQKVGGMLTLGIPAFRLEKDVVNAEIDILKELGVEFKLGVEVGRDKTILQLREEGFVGFYLAIGAQAGRRLGLEGEDAEGVISGVEFLRRINLGESLTLGGEVVVVGGGNVAIDVARAASRVGAAKVRMFCLEDRAGMPALPEEIAEAEAEGIEINNSWGPNRIVTENGRVTGIEFKKCVSVFDENHRFAPKYDESELLLVKAEHLLTSIGQSIDWGELLNGTQVKLKPNGTVIADSLTYQTAEPDIFAGGDVYTGPRFAIDAIAAGKQGAISLHRAVQPGQSLVFGRDRREYTELDKSNTIISGFDTTPRQQAGHTDKNGGFKDGRLSFTEEQMQKETERCLGCGAVVIDEYKCIGCGQCTTKCKFDAITLRKQGSEIAPVFEKLPIQVAKHAVVRTGRIAATAVKETFKK